MAKETHLGSAQLAHTQLAHEVDVTDNQAFSVVSVQAMNALQDILFGSVAGIVGKVIEYPFDTVKVRLQSQPDHLPLRYAGPLDCFKQSLQHEGFAGLYRGVSAPLVGAAVETSSLFFSVRNVVQRREIFAYSGCSTILPKISTDPPFTPIPIHFP